MKFNCLFCNKDILQMDLEEHSHNICKFDIIKYQNGDKYIGEKKNNMKEGFGIYYFDNGMEKFCENWIWYNV